MASLFRGSRYIWLRWSKHVNVAFGNVFAYVDGFFSRIVSFIYECVVTGKFKRNSPVVLVS